MPELEPEYLTPDQAAARLGKSGSQVRRDARSRRLNSVRSGGRVWICVDERFLELERNPSARFPPAGDPFLAKTPGPSGGELPNLVYEEARAEVAELRVVVARLSARLSALEARE